MNRGNVIFQINQVDLASHDAQRLQGRGEFLLHDAVRTGPQKYPVEPPGLGFPNQSRQIRFLAEAGVDAAMAHLRVAA